MKPLQCIVLLVSLLGMGWAVFGLNNGLARTPPMGWNSWYALGAENLNQVSEKYFTNPEFTNTLKQNLHIL
jgi:hypothetical protein